MTEIDFVPGAYTADREEGSVTWQAPSNIALIKYWGKRGNQIPANPSLSFTLNKCLTTTKVSYKKLSSRSDNFSFDLLFDDLPKEDFKPKIKSFFVKIEEYMPFLKDYHFLINTSNTFPHSSGIASSASGMAALALCLMDIERVLNPSADEDFFKRKASFLARLGSGSACRSIDGEIITWGIHKAIANSSDLYAVKYSDEVHKVFKNYRDTILLVHKGQKQVSSTLGHNLMHNHPFAAQRFNQAHENLVKLKSVLASGDLEGFVAIVEQEALTLHAMMMTSSPYFVLMMLNTLKIINAIWDFRKASKTHLCFTLDAGANVHLLYPKNEAAEVLQFIKDELVVYCENGQYICDEIGIGAKKL